MNFSFVPNQGLMVDGRYITEFDVKVNRIFYYIEEDESKKNHMEYELVAKMLDGTDIKIWDFSIDLEKSNTEREFIGLAHDVSIVNEDSISLEDSFTVTYTSGTTNPGRPKAVLHAVRSYMYLARYKDSDVSGMPKMRNIRVFSHIPYYVHASLSTSIVDPLFQGGTIIIEKEYNEESFPKAVIESKPNQVCASVGFWLRLAEYLELHSNTDMSFCAFRRFREKSFQQEKKNT